LEVIHLGAGVVAFIFPAWVSWNWFQG